MSTDPHSSSISTANSTDPSATPWSRHPGAILVALLLVGWGALMVILAVRRPIHVDQAPDPRALASLPDMRIDLNFAMASELQVLPSIGPALAARIIADRETNGPYKSVDDLDRVSGISAAIIATLQPYVVVNPDIDSAAPPGR